MQGWISFSASIRCFLKSRRKGGQDTEHISRAKRKKKSQKPLKKELKLYQEQGIPLYLNGELSSPKSIAEGGGYMRDYTEDEKGRIAQVSFDFIQDK